MTCGSLIPCGNSARSDRKIQVDPTEWTAAWIRKMMWMGIISQHNRWCTRIAYTSAPYPSMCPLMLYLFIDYLGRITLFVHVRACDIFAGGRLDNVNAASKRRIASFTCKWRIASFIFSSSNYFSLYSSQIWICACEQRVRLRGDYRVSVRFRFRGDYRLSKRDASACCKEEA